LFSIQVGRNSSVGKYFESVAAAQLAWHEKEAAMASSAESEIAKQ
jgi:hypothetical protein